MIKMDQPGEQVCIRRACVCVHPTADDIVERLSVKKAVYCDHDPAPKADTIRRPQPERISSPRPPVGFRRQERRRRRSALFMAKCACEVKPIKITLTKTGNKAKNAGI